MANLLAQRSEPIRSAADLTDQERQLVERARKDFQYASKARKPYEDRWAKWYGLHRQYRRFAEEATVASERDRDMVVDEAKRTFGAELFIPYVFAVIETMLPRLLMNNPRMRVKPRHKALNRDRAEAVRMMFEERQREIDYALRLIPVARSGLMYGLGVSKNFWDRKERSTLALERSSIRARIMGPYVKPRVDVNEGPQMEDVDILNFFWDPAAKDLDTSRFVIHRTWRSLDYIAERVKRREWAPVSIEDVKQMSPENPRDSVFKDRQEAAGLTTEQDSSHDRLHEIWEWHHEGRKLGTVLDGQIPVQMGEGFEEYPFSIWRPTLQQTEFVGIGEIEPIVSLQHELNTLRSMRLDNAMLTMQKAFIYAEGLVDPADFIIGPGKGIPVEGGAIADAIQPINFGELPGSAYQETQEIKSDIELATAVSEAVAGGGGSSGGANETATGAQIVQAAANTRVELKTKMLSHEAVASDTRQWLEMFRQHTLLTPREIAVEGPQGYEWVEITGEDLDLVEAVLPEDDSLAPENGPQKRNDALALNNQLAGEQVIDPRKRVRYLLDAHDIPDADAWILPEQMEMNPQVAQQVGQTLHATLLEAGMDEEKAQAVTLAVMQRSMEQAGVSEPPGADQEQSNGTVPQEAPA